MLLLERQAVMPTSRWLRAMFSSLYISGFHNLPLTSSLGKPNPEVIQLFQEYIRHLFIEMLDLWKEDVVASRLRKDAQETKWMDDPSYFTDFQTFSTKLHTIETQYLWIPMALSLPRLLLPTTCFQALGYKEHALGITD